MLDKVIRTYYTEAMEIDRDFKTVGDSIVLLAKVNGKRIKFVFSDRAEAYRDFKKLRKAGAEYLNTGERPERWISAPRALDLTGRTL